MAPRGLTSILPYPLKIPLKWNDVAADTVTPSLPHRHKEHLPEKACPWAGSAVFRKKCVENL
jgi:hypothetical protein